MFSWTWNLIRTHLIEAWLEADPADRAGLIVKWGLVMVLIGVIIAVVRHYVPIPSPL